MSFTEDLMLVKPLDPKARAVKDKDGIWQVKAKVWDSVCGNYSFAEIGSLMTGSGLTPEDAARDFAFKLEDNIRNRRLVLNHKKREMFWDRHEKRFVWWLI